MAPTDKSIDTTAAEAYEQLMVPGMFLRWTQRLVELAAPKPGEHVLDVACGTGIGARCAAPRVSPAGKIAGLDIDPGVIEVARRIAAEAAVAIDWHCASALEMPFEARTFDLALCLQGLQFFPDRVKGLSEIRRVLKPAGRLVASIWASLEFNKGHEAVVQALERQKVDASAAQRACSFADVDDIRLAAAQAGFARVDVRSESGVSQFSSVQCFIDAMARGSPSTRHAIGQLSPQARASFEDEVREVLEPYVVAGALEYPMRTHILLARPEL